MLIRNVFSQEIIINAFTFNQYKDLCKILFDSGKSTSVDLEYNTTEILDYVKINLQRMNRVEKTFKMNPTLQEKLSLLNKKQLWIVLAESWCGDVAQNIPAINMIANSTTNIELKILLRDENEVIMNKYLTNGSKSIPKLISLNPITFKENWNWGPRPKPAQELVVSMKSKGEDFHIGVHKWYADDKSNTIQDEILKLISNN
ncbi:MAG: thioredoxin family protein [Chlorobiota bacterium]|nr:thioredoxin family protein [Chlorobiota bacterium]QQS67331.1 MAG: thioredoxin family protein [Chlorobiota bacterium]